jgi:hypothetical protein
MTEKINLSMRFDARQGGFDGGVFPSTLMGGADEVVEFDR